MAASVSHGFSASSLDKKLKGLSGTLQSIQGTAVWIIHHRKNAKTIVSLWYKELQKGGGQKFTFNDNMLTIVHRSNTLASSTPVPVLMLPSAFFISNLMLG
jgi:hypothetical protein